MPSKKKKVEKKEDTPTIIPAPAVSPPAQGIYITVEQDQEKAKETSTVISQEPHQPVQEKKPAPPKKSKKKPTKEEKKEPESKNDAEPEDEDDLIFKKRGRKPKGGKLINKQPDTTASSNNISNVILHLKCSLNDLTDYNTEINKLLINNLEYNPSIPPEISTYDEPNNNFYLIGHQEQSIETAYQKENNFVLCAKCNNNIKESDKISNDNDNVSIKDINAKLKKLKISFYKNLQTEKNSACFWCTYDFDNPPCYIPKYEMDEKIYGYGSFCRPECAVAFLMKESIDDSTKFERYHLLNNIYGKVYNYTKNIKPAPNPYYLLDKFYGNLTIQEYRKLLKTEHFLLVIDKPLTRLLPELHEDTEEISIFSNSGNSVSKTTNGFGGYKVKKQSEKQQGPSKSSIIKDKFNL